MSAATSRLERANLSFATALVATLDARDRYTAGHSAAVAIYARDIAARLGLSDEEQQLAHQCGLVHDIGKIGLPPGLLEKPGALTLGERRQMEKHSEIGERILDKVEDYAEIAKIVRHHHERWDGQGYPDGIADHEIPLISRIISVADAYNAMTSDRPYRDAMPSRVARMRLAQGVESQFDTTIVAAFEAILAGADEEYRTGRRADFSLADQDVYSEPTSEPELETAPSSLSSRRSSRRSPTSPRRSPRAVSQQARRSAGVVEARHPGEDQGDEQRPPRRPGAPCAGGGEAADCGRDRLRPRLQLAQVARVDDDAALERRESQTRRRAARARRSARPSRP